MNDWHRVAVRYGGGRTIAVKGPVTGVEYVVSGSRRVVWMDPRDALVLTRERTFTLDGAAMQASARLDGESGA
ncbi:hypothetical protein [Caballeronia sp. BCC1704]|uniref:hypothetical protein n=1 Tax=Caballeronia sp. BCC1704 TaxID=2676300 RepID=UPI001588769F|nr:hypothetical protein [Caballeronia sp. BCC1704]